MGSLEKGVTYFAGLLALAIVVRNGDSVSNILRSITRGANAISATLLVGSSAGGNPPMGNF